MRSHNVKIDENFPPPGMIKRYAGYRGEPLSSQPQFRTPGIPDPHSPGSVPSEFLVIIQAFWELFSLMFYKTKMSSMFLV